MVRSRTMKRDSRRRSPAPAPQLQRRVQPPLKRSPRRQRMSSGLKRMIWIVLGAMSVMTLLLYPFERSVVPAWSVQVLDENDHPVAGIDVQQEWGQFGPEERFYADSRLSGADGWVEFPERAVPVSLGPLALKYLLTSGLPPAADKDRQVPFSLLFVCRQGKTGEITWERGQGRPGRLLVHKGFCQYSPQPQGI